CSHAGKKAVANCERRSGLGGRSGIRKRANRERKTVHLGRTRPATCQMSLEICPFAVGQRPECIGCGMVGELVVNLHTRSYGAQGRKDASSSPHFWREMLFRRHDENDLAALLRREFPVIGVRV